MLLHLGTLTSGKLPSQHVSFVEQPFGSPLNKTAANSSSVSHPAGVRHLKISGANYILCYDYKKQMHALLVTVLFFTFLTMMSSTENDDKSKQNSSQSIRVIYLDSDLNTDYRNAGHFFRLSFGVF